MNGRLQGRGLQFFPIRCTFFWQNAENSWRRSRMKDSIAQKKKALLQEIDNLREEYQVEMPKRIAEAFRRVMEAA